MVQNIRTLQGFIGNDRRRWLSHTLLGGAALTSILAGVWALETRPAPKVAGAPATAIPNPYGPMLVDLGVRSRVVEAKVETPAPAAAPETQTPETAAVQEPQRATVDAPLPPRRPAELKTLAMRMPAAAALRQMARQETTTAAPAAPAENNSFFEKIFGGASQPATQQPAPTGRPNAAGRQQPPAQALAYAAPETTGGLFGGLTRAATPAGPAPRAGAQTAVYDISAHTVYMPDGTQLEAHSGLREHLDDPRFVHVRMKGPTPPSVYQLSPREALFHGVEALRLTPISGSVYGRAGLLAHTYMLGPNGDSNGCVSFRDYAAFLRAYKSGQVRRLVVVAHR